MTGQGKASAGQAIGNIIADVLHKVIVSVSPHVHADRTRATAGMLKEIADGAQTDLAPLMGHVLDTGKVHPLLVPVVTKLAGRAEPPTPEP